MAGLAGFAAASAGRRRRPGLRFAGGRAGRAGRVRCLAGPSALALLALLATTFTDARERGKALGVFTAIAGGLVAIV
jgi:hypothetical protein